VNNGRNETAGITAPSPPTGNRATSISANCPVITARDEPATRIEDVLIRLALINTDFQYAAIKTHIGVAN